MDSTTLLYRQVNPSWVQAGRVTSQAFRPTPKDKDLLSMYDGSLIGPEVAWAHFTEQLRCASVGVVAVSVAECSEVELEARPDPAPFPEHAVIDFTGKSTSQRRKCAELLRSKSDARGWLFEAPAS